MKQKWIKIGDKVLVLNGNDRGKVGEVLAKKDSRILVQGVNVRKRHTKPLGWDLVVETCRFGQNGGHGRL